MKIVKIEKTQVNKVVEIINSSERTKVVKMVSNPKNETQLRIYFDDCGFLEWIELQDVSEEEKVEILENIKDGILKIQMNDEEWNNENYWVTSRMELHYLKQEKGIEKWWYHETQAYKDKINKQIEGII